MITPVGAALLVSLAGCFASPLFAQQTRPEASVLEQGLRTPANVRVHVGGEVLIGTGRIAGDTLLLMAAGMPLQRLDVTRLDSLFIQGNKAKSGATTDAILGLLPFAVLGGYVYGGITGKQDLAVLPGVLVGGAIGAAGGALIGLAVGQSVPRWVRVLP